jgi:hypothetical protein
MLQFDSISELCGFQFQRESKLKPFHNNQSNEECLHGCRLQQKRKGIIQKENDINPPREKEIK